MAESNYIVAIELGSSKITGIAGTKTADGSIKVLAYAQKDSTPFIRKGVVFNIDKTVAALIEIKKQIEDTIDRPISRAYVGVCGQSTHGKLRVVARHFMEETRITPELVDGIIDENSSQIQPEEDILDVVVQEYKIGNTSQIDPVGALTTLIEGNFLNIVARSSIRANIQKCFEQAGIQIVEYIISPEACATIALAPAEMRSGCALVDIGAETTTVSIYKSGILRYLSVVPLGASAITRDLCTLPVPIEEEEAEELKRKYGTALSPRNEEDTIPGNSSEVTTIPLSNGRSLDLKLLTQCTSARAKEILANAEQQIKNSGYEGELLGGVILTGGGSNLNKIEESMQHISKIKPCRIASGIRSNLKVSGSYPSNAKDGAHLTLLGLLAWGNEDCCPAIETSTGESETAPVPIVVNPVPEPQPRLKPQPEPEPQAQKPKGPGFGERFKTWINKMMEEDKE